MAAGRYLIVAFLLPSMLYGGSQISGRIVNASHDSIAVAATRVYLQKMSEGVPEPQTVVDGLSSADGSFRFSVASPDTGVTYFLAADYQTIRYFSSGAKLSDGSSETLNLAVYDTTHSTTGVEAFMHHIIIDDLGDALSFRETRVLNNAAAKTIVGAFVDEGAGESIFKFHLPPQATNFSPLSSHGEDELVQIGHSVYDRGIFMPGNKTISFSYEIPMANNTVQLTLNVTHAARMFDLFINQNSVQVESPQLNDNGDFAIRGTTYRRFGAADLPANTDIAVRFIRQQRAAADQQSPLLICIAAGIVLAAGLLYTLLHKGKTLPQSQKTTPEELRRQKFELFKKIAEIDQSTATESAPESRQALMKELQAIELQLLQAEKKSRRKK
jgi:hypothetical protein